MIKTQQLIPEVYYNESRDFQLFGRIFDILFNYSKTNADLVLHDNLLELKARNVGFFPKHAYDDNALAAVISIFKYLIKNKGTLTAIETLISTVLKAENLKDNSSVSIDSTDAYLLHLIITPGLGDSEILLIEDVLEYILPIGMKYEIYQASAIDTESINIANDDAISIYTTPIEKQGKLSNNKEDKLLETIDKFNIKHTSYTGDINMTSLTTKNPDSEPEDNE